MPVYVSKIHYEILHEKLTDVIRGATNLVNLTSFTIMVEYCEYTLWMRSPVQDSIWSIRRPCGPLSTQILAILLSTYGEQCCYGDIDDEGIISTCSLFGHHSTDWCVSLQYINRDKCKECSFKVLDERLDGSVSFWCSFLHDLNLKWFFPLDPMFCSFCRWESCHCSYLAFDVCEMFHLNRKFILFVFWRNLNFFFAGFREGCVCTIIVLKSKLTKCLQKQIAL